MQRKCSGNAVRGMKGTLVKKKREEASQLVSFEVKSRKFNFERPVQ